MNFIEELYYGNINPNEKRYDGHTDYAKAMRKFCNNENELNTFVDGKPRHEDVEHIKRELERSDNMQLHKKIDILKAFLDEVVMGLDGTQDIDAEYDEFENKQKQAEIESFAKTEDIDVKMLSEFISEYSFSGVLNQGEVRDRIEKPMPLLKKKSLVTRIVEFIKSHVSKYSS